MHSAHNVSLFLIITDSAKILHAYDELFLENVESKGVDWVLYNV